MNAFRFRLSCAALAATLHGLAFAAEFPTVVNGVLTLDTRESVTYDQPLPGDVSQLVKTGVGEAVLTAATTAFTGAVDVQAGTLTLKDAGAVGTGTKIEVTGDAATLHLNFANPGGWDTVFFAGHDVTIRGQGVDGKGAFRYTDSGDGSTQNDNMLESLTLSGDACIAVPSRFGVNAKIDLAGHTLTRVDLGSGKNLNWMLRSSKSLHITKGEIVNKAGVIACQSAPVFESPDETTLVMEGGWLGMFAIEKLNCKVVFSGGEFKGMYAGENSIAKPVTIEKELKISQLKSAYVSRMSGKTDATADVVLTGKGFHYFDGPFKTTASVFFQGGTTFISNDFMIDNMLRLGATGKVAEPCAVYQTAGNFKTTDASGWIVRLGQTEGIYSAYVVSGGSADFASLLNIGSGTGSSSLVLVDGGEIRATNGVITATNDKGGVPSRSLIRVSGGGRFTAESDYAYDRTKVTKLANGDGATGVLALTGEGSFYETAKVILGPERGVATSHVIITDGGVLKVGRLYCGNAEEASSSGVFANGGVIKPTFWVSWAENYLNADQAAPQHWVLGEQGMVVDLAELKAESANVTVSEESELIVKNDLSDWTGRGIASVSLPTDNEAYANESYCGPAFVEIEGPNGGHGAVAVAECDPLTRKLTGVSILAPGSDYDETAKVFVRSADGATRYECSYALTKADRAGGKLVKRGTPALGLSGINAYTGGTIVEAGVLRIRGEKSFPENTPLTVRPDATLAAEGMSLTVSTLAGLGGAIKCKTLTVTKELRVTVADLFAADAQPLTVNAALSFGENVVVKIVDPENLAAHSQERSRVVLRAMDGLAGAVPVLSGEVGEKWFLIKSGNALKFGSRRGICLIVR